MTIALFVVLLLAGTAAVIAPLARRPVAWPVDPPDQRDDVARAVSSLRDLEFARAAGTIAPADYARLRASLERDAFARPAPQPRGAAPVRTLVAASLIAAVAVGVAVFYLPPSAGDRAPGETVTGTVPAMSRPVARRTRSLAIRRCWRETRITSRPSMGSRSSSSRQEATTVRSSRRTGCSRNGRRTQTHSS